MANLLDAKQVSQILRVNSSTLRRWVKTGYFIVPYKVGRKHKWNEQEVLAWIETKRI